MSRILKSLADFFSSHLVLLAKNSIAAMDSRYFEVVFGSYWGVKALQSICRTTRHEWSQKMSKYIHGSTRTELATNVPHHFAEDRVSLKEMQPENVVQLSALAGWRGANVAANACRCARSTLKKLTQRHTRRRTKQILRACFCRVVVPVHHPATSPVLSSAIQNGRPGRAKDRHRLVVGNGWCLRTICKK